MVTYTLKQLTECVRKIFCSQFSVPFLHFFCLSKSRCIFKTNKESSTVLCSVVKHDTERETDSNIA